ncbi:DNA helicase II [Amnimonas aquatica]|uniref:DNA 3'-5' helicase n=1 Tax=Amnimonas aquatica TaxID=2094561 RepID=A0A2P6ASK9_9GAMM|nr:DNA helicase II [Amnimonas aquatica]PQA42767.1 DNA helicase II [Amnimonas aquatica]
MNESDLLAGLNPAQRDAVTCDSQHLLVLAGAGSGKTRVLTTRISHFCREFGMSPFAVLAVTFTNKAAHEMRARLEQQLGIATQPLWIGTFHGLAHRFLRMHYKEANLPQTFQILDADDQQRVIKRVLRDLQLDEEKWPARQAAGFINGHKEEGRRPQHIRHNGDLFTATQLRVYEAYEVICQRGGLIDFAEILLRSYELWLNHPELLRHYQARFRMILVDEFQDTNRIQYAWLRLLAGEHGMLTAVGDDDQSIYGWRGACIENIRTFQRDYGDVELIRLEQNYRSTSIILQAANAVIANNGDRLGKNLWTDRGQGDPIRVYAAFNDLDEAHFIARMLDERFRAGTARRDMAILYRSNAQSRVLEEALLRGQIPYRIYGGLRFFERAEIKNAVAYLRLLQQRDDDTAFERVVNTPTRGIGDKSVDTLRQLAREQGISLWAAALAVTREKLLPAAATGKIMAFLQLVETLDVTTREVPLGELVSAVIEQTGLIAHHEKEKGEKGQARVENLRELVTAAREFDVEDDEAPSPLAAFLDHAALEAGEQQAGEFEDAVQLMTLHAAKGLEFPVVFLAGCEEGLFPHEMALQDNNLEEERRLCYVGITRAMRELFMTYAEVRRLYGSENYKVPSRFLREIPESLLEPVRQQSAPAFGGQRGGFGSQGGSAGTRMTGGGSGSLRQTTLGGDATGEGAWQLGQRVSHPRFGEGVILAFEGNGPNARIQVNFADLGSKWLVAQYARLTRI